MGAKNGTPFFDTFFLKRHKEQVGGSIPSGGFILRVNGI
jgi:hypothetical protein